MSPHDACESAVLCFLGLLFFSDNGKTLLRNYESNVTNDCSEQVAGQAGLKLPDDYGKPAL
jgi:hypothetical protein